MKEPVTWGKPLVFWGKLWGELLGFWGESPAFRGKVFNSLYLWGKTPVFSTSFPQAQSLLSPLDEKALKLFPQFPQALLLLPLNLKNI